MSIAGYALHRGKIRKEDLAYRGFFCEDGDELIERWILSEKPSLVGFSTYVWNAPAVYRISQRLKERAPGIRIVLGGPDVAWNPVTALERQPSVDFVAAGEGEATFSELYHALSDGRRAFGEIQDICFRENGRVQTAPSRPPIPDLNEASFPWELLRDSVAESASKTGLLRYETSRGCPFSCSYCSWDVSGTGSKLRTISTRKVAEDVAFFFSFRDLNLLSFVDSDIMIPAPRAKEILRALIDANRARIERGWEPVDARFYMNPEFIDEEILELLRSPCFRSNYYSIGLQTANPPALKASNRVFHREKYTARFKRFKESINNAAIFLDLIYGLPGDDYAGYKHSLEYAFELDPHMLSLFQFVIVPGSEFAEHPEKHGIEFFPFPPYEVVRTGTFSRQDMLKAQRLSRFVSLVFNNVQSVREGLRRFSRDHGTRIVDAYEDFMRYLERRRFEFTERPFVRHQSFRTPNPAWEAEDMRLEERLADFCGRRCLNAA